MPILFPLLLTAATMTGPAVPVAVPRPHIASPSLAGAPLTAAVSAAAKREALSASRGLAAAAWQYRQTAGQRSGRNSIATRVTAIFAGAVLGSVAGMVAGGAIDAATSNGECLTATVYGMPIGAAVGGFLTARWVR